MKKPVLHLALVLAALWSGSGSLLADDATELDLLFDQPPSDVIAPSTTPKAPPAVPVDPVTVFGSFSASAAGVSDFLRSSLYQQSTVLVGIDARPSDALRVLATLGSHFPDGQALSFTPPRLTQMFLDYTPVDWAALRLGQYDLTWGQTRLVSNTGNLVAEVGSGISAKIYVPWGAGGTTAVVSGSGTLDSSSTPSQYLYAGLFEQTWGPVTWSLAASNHRVSAPQATGSLKSSWAGADWFVESVGTWNETGGLKRVDVSTGFLWQGFYPSVTVTGEYQVVKIHDGLENDQHTLAMALSIDGKRPWGIVPKLQWLHGLDDQSGQLSGVLDFETDWLPYLGLSAGVNGVYGPANGRFVLANADPGKRPWGLGLKVTWSYRF